MIEHWYCLFLLSCKGEPYISYIHMLSDGESAIIFPMVLHKFHHFMLSYSKRTPTVVFSRFLWNAFHKSAMFHMRKKGISSCPTWFKYWSKNHWHDSIITDPLQCRFSCQMKLLCPVSWQCKRKFVAASPIVAEVPVLTVLLQSIHSKCFSLISMLPSMDMSYFPTN